MQLKSLSAFVAVGLLVAATLACNTITGGGLNNVQATANAVLTQASSGDFAATAEAAQATADAALNNPGATEEATAGSDGEAEATATTASDSTGITGNGPEDVPIIDAENNILFTSAEIVSYYTKADFATTVQFYKDEMPNNGWELDATSTVETPDASVLSFKKDNRVASLSITVDTTTSQTIVLATISTQ